MFTRWLMADTFGAEDTAPDVPAWMAEAACAGADPGDWFPSKGNPGKTAKAVCAHCLVREPCLQLALDEGHTHGVWGGRTPKERSVVRHPQGVPST